MDMGLYVSVCIRAGIDTYLHKNTDLRISQRMKILPSTPNQELSLLRCCFSLCLFPNGDISLPLQITRGLFTRVTLMGR